MISLHTVDGIVQENENIKSETRDPIKYEKIISDLNNKEIQKIDKMILNDSNKQ